MFGQEINAEETAVIMTVGGILSEVNFELSSIDRVPAPFCV